MIIIKRLINKKKRFRQTFDLDKGCEFSPFALQNPQPIMDEGDYGFD